MKKYLHIPIALLLITVGIWGCTMSRPRPLMDCLPPQPWEKLFIDAVETPQPEDLETVEAILTDITVRPQGKFRVFSGSYAQFSFYSGDRFTAAIIAANGDIILTELHTDGKTYWHTGDTELCQELVQKYGLVFFD